MDMKAAGQVDIARGYGSRREGCGNDRTGRSRNALGAVPACAVTCHEVRFSAAFRLSASAVVPFRLEPW
jgi:hypothetical protein